MLMAARRGFISAERVVETEDLLKEGSVHTLRINRFMTDGVVEAPNGAHFTSCEPDYRRDESISSPRQRLNEPRVFRRVAEYLANLVDGCV